MGFKDADDDWIQHQDEFNSLLNSLANGETNKVSIAEEDSTKNSVKSLEEKSKNSRARVQYVFIIDLFIVSAILNNIAKIDFLFVFAVTRNLQEEKISQDIPKMIWHAYWATGKRNIKRMKIWKRKWNRILKPTRIPKTLLE